MGRSRSQSSPRTGNGRRAAPSKARADAAGTLPVGQIVAGDFLQLREQWPAGSVDLIFADPPYNIGFGYDQYEDRLPDEAYIDWTQQWISAAADLLKPSGSLYVLIGDEYAAEARLHLKHLQQQGKLLFRNWIVWHYTFGQRCRLKFSRSHAHLFYCVGSAALGVGGRARSNLTKLRPFTFNDDAVALPSARMTTYADRRANPRGKLPDDTWYLKRFPETLKWYSRPQEAGEETETDYFAPDSDTWNQSRLCGTFHERMEWHPCQLPEALLERIVKVSSNPGDVVFDPFTGSGTTLAVAKRLGRQWFGAELSEDYAAKARRRLSDVEADAVAADDAEAPADQPASKPSNGRNGKANAGAGRSSAAGRGNRKASAAGSSRSRANGKSSNGRSPNGKSSNGKASNGET